MCERNLAIGVDVRWACPWRPATGSGSIATRATPSRRATASFAVDTSSTRRGEARRSPPRWISCPRSRCIGRRRTGAVSGTRATSTSSEGTLAGAGRPHEAVLVHGPLHVQGILGLAHLLSDNVVSIGVEFNRRELHLPLQDRDRFVAFLRNHRALADILEPAELLDFSAYVELPRCARRFFSTDRWFLAGMSGFFVDVMGSNTSRVYSEVNRFIGEIIRADQAGDEERFRRRIDISMLMFAPRTGASCARSPGTSGTAASISGPIISERGSPSTSTASSRTA